MEASEPEINKPRIALSSLITELKNFRKNATRTRQICYILIDFISDQTEQSEELKYLSSIEVLKVYHHQLQCEFSMKCLSNVPTAILNLISALCDKKCIDFEKLEKSHFLSSISTIVSRVAKKLITYKSEKKPWLRDFTLMIENLWGWSLKISTNFLKKSDEMIPSEKNLSIFAHVKSIFNLFLEGKFTREKFPYLWPENFYESITTYMLKAMENEIYVEIFRRLGFESLFTFLKTKRENEPEWIKNFDCQVFEILTLISAEMPEELLNADIMSVLNDYLHLNFEYLAENRPVHYQSLQVRNAFLTLITQLIINHRALIKFHFLQMERPLIYLNMVLGCEETLMQKICYLAQSEAFATIQLKVQESLEDVNGEEIRSYLERFPSSSELLEPPIWEEEEEEKEIEKKVPNEVCEMAVEVQPEVETRPPEMENIENNETPIRAEEIEEKEEGELDDDDSSLEFVDGELPERQHHGSDSSGSPQYSSDDVDIENFQNEHPGRQHGSDSSGSPQYSSEDLDIDSYCSEQEFEDDSEIDYPDDGPIKFDREGSSELDVEGIDLEDTKENKKEIMNQYSENIEDQQNNGYPKNAILRNSCQNQDFSNLDESNFERSRNETESDFEISSVHSMTENEIKLAKQNFSSDESEYANHVQSSERIEVTENVENVLEIFPVRTEDKFLQKQGSSKLPEFSESLIPPPEPNSSQKSTVRLCSSDYGGSSSEEEEYLEESFSKISSIASASTPNRSSDFDRSYSDFEMEKFEEHKSRMLAQQPRKTEVPNDLSKSQDNFTEDQNDSDSDVEFIDEWKPINFREASNKPDLHNQVPKPDDFSEEETDVESGELPESDSEMERSYSSNIEPSDFESNFKSESETEVHETLELETGNFESNLVENDPTEKLNTTEVMEEVIQTVDIETSNKSDSETSKVEGLDSTLETEGPSETELEDLETKIDGTVSKSKTLDIRNVNKSDSETKEPSLDSEMIQKIEVPKSNVVDPNFEIEEPDSESEVPIQPRESKESQEKSILDIQFPNLSKPSDQNLEIKPNSETKVPKQPKELKESQKKANLDIEVPNLSEPVDLNLEIEESNSETEVLIQSNEIKESKEKANLGIEVPNIEIEGSNVKIKSGNVSEDLEIEDEPKNFILRTENPQENKTEGHLQPSNSSSFEIPEQKSELNFETKNVPNLDGMETPTKSETKENSIENQAETSQKTNLGKRSRSIFDLSETSTPDESMDEDTDGQAYPLDLHFKSPAFPSPGSSPPKKLSKLSPIFQPSGPHVRNPFSEADRSRIMNSEGSDRVSEVNYLKNENSILDLSTPNSSTTEESYSSTSDETVTSEIQRLADPSIWNTESDLELDVSDDMILDPVSVSQKQEDVLQPETADKTIEKNSADGTS